MLTSYDPGRLIQKFFEGRNKLIYLLRPCRVSAKPTASDPRPLLFTNFVAQLNPFSMHLMAFPDKPWRANHWSLEVLGIHPAYQGKGHGKDLAEWGLAKTKCDTAAGVTGLPSVVCAADTKEAFYQKVGFNELVGWSSRSVEGVEGENPLEARGCGGGAVLWSWVKEDEARAKGQLEEKARYGTREAEVLHPSTNQCRTCTPE